jgi:hypothetical protein
MGVKGIATRTFSDIPDLQDVNTKWKELRKQQLSNRSIINLIVNKGCEGWKIVSWAYCIKVNVQCYQCTQQHNLEFKAKQMLQMSDDINKLP